MPGTRPRELKRVQSLAIPLHLTLPTQRRGCRNSSRLQRGSRGGARRDGFTSSHTCASMGKGERSFATNRVKQEAYTCRVCEKGRRCHRLASVERDLHRRKRKILRLPKCGRAGAVAGRSEINPVRRRNVGLGLERLKDGRRNRGANVRTVPPFRSAGGDGRRGSPHLGV